MTNGQARRALRWVGCGLLLGCGGEAAGEGPPLAVNARTPQTNAGAPAAGEQAAPATGSGGNTPRGVAGKPATNPAVEAGGGDADAGAAPAGAPAAAGSGMPGPREYSLTMCPGATPKGLPTERKDCDGVIRCGGASRCLAGMSDHAGRAPECSTGRCVPDVVAMAGRIRFQPCDGSAGPGVCVPQCFAVQRNPLSAVFELGEAGCGTQEVCVPCRSPLDQADTGACDDTCAESTAP